MQKYNSIIFQMFRELHLDFQPSASVHQTLAFQATHLYRRYLQPLKKKKN